MVQTLSKQSNTQWIMTTPIKLTKYQVRKVLSDPLQVTTPPLQWSEYYTLLTNLINIIFFRDKHHSLVKLYDLCRIWFCWDVIDLVDL